MDGSHHRLPTVLQSLDHGLTSPGDLLQLEEEYGRRGNRNSGKSEGWGQRRVGKKGRRGIYKMKMCGKVG